MDIAARLVRAGRADQSELDAIAGAWRTWSPAPDGWISLLPGEIIGRSDHPRHAEIFIPETQPISGRR